MADTYFTADLHFGHENIIKYCNRPFENADKMNAMLIEFYNARVGVNDTCYFLGDIGFCGANELAGFLKRMNGRKILIFGNHDTIIRKNRPLFEKIFDAMHELLELKMDGQRYVLCHYPMLAWPRGIMLHGHCHGTAVYPKAGLPILDVGVDCHGYAPINAQAVKASVASTPALDPEEAGYYLKAR